MAYRVYLEERHYDMDRLMEYQFRESDAARGAAYEKYYADMLEKV